MTGDDCVGAFVQSVITLLETIRNQSSTSAVIRIEEGNVLAREDIAGMNNSQRREQNPGITIGVATSEVIQIDFVRALEQRHFVFECTFRQPFTPVLLKDRLSGYGLVLSRAIRNHLLHVSLRVFLHDDIDRGWEFDIAADVVAMGVGIDQCRDGFVCEFLDLVENRLTPAGILRVDNNHSVRGHEHRRVATAAFEHPQVVLEFLGLHNSCLLTAASLLRSDDYGQRAERKQCAQNNRSFHN